MATDLIREALENLVRQQDGLPQVLAKLRRQGLPPDHPTVTATIEGHRVCMDRAWQQAREAIARTPYGVKVRDEALPQDCPECGNAYLTTRTDIYKDGREFIYCDTCGCLADKRVWNRITPKDGVIVPAEGQQ